MENKNREAVKVVQLSTVHPRYDTRILIKTSVSLVNAGYNVTFLVSDLQESEVFKGVKIRSIGYFDGSRVKKMFCRIIAMSKAALAEDAAVYHFHDPELMILAFILKLKGKKVIYDIHEDVPRQVLRKSWLPKPLRRPLSIFVSFCEFLTARTVDAIITVTPTIARRFSFTRVIETRNYVDLNEFSTSSTGCPEDKNLIAYVGGITEARGVIPMVNAMENMNNKITLVGKFQENGLENYCKKLNGWRNVDFLGWKSRDHIVAILKRSQIGLVVLQPTGDYEDAYPVKLFEYMASGVAVIASNFDLWREIIEKENCGVCVDPTNSDEIEKAIIYLIDNKDIAIQMGINGRQAVERKYNWNSQVRALVELYSEILSK